MTEFNLDELLASILDPSKPLPEASTITAPPPAPPIVEAVQAALAPEVDSLSTIINATETTEAPQPTTIDTVFADTEERKGYELPAVQVPNFTNEEIASAIDIRNFATLATLQTSRWHAKVKDRSASRDAATAAGAVEDAFETSKRLLAGADTKLKRIHKAIDKARAIHYEYTVPWSTAGVEDTQRRTGARLLPNTSFFDYISAMGEATREMDAAVADFVPDYPNLVQQAQKNLGTRFDPTEYPHESTIASHFGISFDFQPIPQGTDFKGLPDAQCQALADAIESKKRTMMENAMADLWIRAHEAVGRMAERLSHPDKTFHHTLVENVAQVAKQLKHLNITGDARVEEIRQYIVDNLINHDVDDLRKTPATRIQVAGHAQTVVDMMTKYGKGA